MYYFIPHNDNPTISLLGKFVKISTRLDDTYFGNDVFDTAVFSEPDQHVDFDYDGTTKVYKLNSSQGGRRTRHRKTRRSKTRHRKSRSNRRAKKSYRRR